MTLSIALVSLTALVFSSNLPVLATPNECDASVFAEILSDPQFQILPQIDEELERDMYSWIDEDKKRVDDEKKTRVARLSISSRKQAILARCQEKEDELAHWVITHQRNPSHRPFDVEAISRILDIELDTAEASCVFSRCMFVHWLVYEETATDPKVVEASVAARRSMWATFFEIRRREKFARKRKARHSEEEQESFEFESYPALKEDVLGGKA